MIRQESYYCKHCGKTVSPEGVYCKHCGLPLGGTFREETGERRRGRNPVLLSGAERYWVVERLWSSDRASVDLARDLRLGRQVLIRRPGISVITSPEGLSAFLRALRTSARLRHPGIAAVYEEGADKEGPYGVVEYVEGQSLRDRLQGGHRMELQEVLRLGVDLADSLHYAHQQDVVHGNLTPARVMMDPQGRCRLHSFGRIEIPELPLRRTEFDAPDLQPLVPQVADDVYALGMLLRTMLLGAPGPASDPAIPVSLREILAGALASHASERWRSMEELRDALSAVGGRRLRARDGRCPECGVFDAEDSPFCGNCGSNLQDLFRTCDGCGHRQHQRHSVCGRCGSNLEDQGKLALEQVFLALQAGGWDAVAREIRRLRLLGAEFEASDAEHGAGVLMGVSHLLEETWKQGRWETVQIALPLVGEVARTLGILPPAVYRRLAENLGSCTRLVAEASELARERKLSQAQARINRCRELAPNLPKSSEDVANWIDSMVVWFEERLAEARALAASGRLKEARERAKLALEHIHKEDPLVARAQSVFVKTKESVRETSP
ncbi:MAG TPA: protein kinase [Fibrobacteria bacterium]|nr:protein kinase [Fibrobacteria bacterium]